LRIIPYRTAENVIDGVVLTFQNIDRPKREVELVREFFESIVETIRDPLLVLDAEFHVHFVNDAFCRVIESSRRTVHQRPFFELAGKPWNDPQLRQRLESVIRDGVTFNDFIIEGEFAESGRKRFRLKARRLDRGPHDPKMVLVVLEELGEVKT
jgi:two-component system CheB/CheR fusion protein